jgi:hypothetical protein
MVMQRGCLGLPFGCGAINVFSGSSWALTADVITLKKNKSNKGTVKRFSKGTSFSLLYGFEYLSYNDTDKCSFGKIF